MSQGPLSGVRIIDLTIAAAGPYSTAILASQGAEVIKVERPDGGDFLRTAGAMSGGISAVFASWNRGKQSVCINLQHPEGAALVRKLVADADVLVHNLRPGNAEKMGLGYEDLRKIKPELVYAYLTGWGERGPKAGAPAYDTVVQAAAGYAAHQGDPQTGEPRFIRNGVCDKTSGMALSQLITAALFARSRTGKGQRVHMSMLHSALAFLWSDAMQPNTFLDGGKAGATGAKGPPLHRTADGWMSISATIDAEYQSLCRVLGLTELARDARFVSAGARSLNQDEMWAAIDPLLARYRSAELAEKFTANRVPHAIVNTPANVHEDPQVVAIDALEVQQHPHAGRTRLPRPNGDFSATPLATPSPAPLLGQDTDAVLGKLGVSEAERARLRAAGTIA
jgi:crotonobetainyl-CoA:carnitine CoA-transferase CaiB-like acyl-CoA transferase